MPYISQARRAALDPPVEALQAALAKLGLSEGDLNYVVSRLAGYYFRAETSYHTIARVRGALMDAADEFYRRLAVGYEKRKREENGDVPEYAPPRKLAPLVFPNHPVMPTKPAAFDAPGERVELGEGSSLRVFELASLEHSPHRVLGHPSSKCAGRPCTLHNRSAHHMRGWPQYWRDDAQLMERTCSHGVGHPDPDDLKAPTYRHGCDGCCRP